MITQAVQAVGTPTGKIVHLAETVSDWPWTLCGRTVKSPLYRGSVSDANCRKCIDRRDLEIGKRGHQLSITSVPVGATWSEATGIKGSCSCGAIEKLPSIAKGTDLVVWHEAHVLAAVRKPTTDPRAHPEQNPETCTACGDGVPFHDAEALRACGLIEETK